VTRNENVGVSKAAAVLDGKKVEERKEKSKLWFNQKHCKDEIWRDNPWGNNTVSTMCFIVVVKKRLG
jgi:hypothetical protein